MLLAFVSIYFTTFYVACKKIALKFFVLFYLLVFFFYTALKVQKKTQFLLDRKIRKSEQI